MRLWKRVLVSMFMLAGCTGSDGGGEAAPTPDTTSPPGPDVARPTPTDPKDLTAQEKEFQTKFAQILTDADKATYASLAADYPVPPPADTLGYDPLAAGHMDLIRQKLELTAAEEAKLKETGFVVSERLHYPTPAWAFHDTFYKDLPLLITADSVLHAMHRSFDEILKTLESNVLYGRVDAFLKKTHLAAGTVPAPGPAGEAARDVDVFFAVARSLLAGETVPTLAGGDADEAVGTLLAAVAEQRLMTVELFGKPRIEDFSQFEPRGHYEETEQLKRYFKAMMWLGRIDLRFREFDEMTGEPLWNDRQIRASWVIHAAVQAAGTYDGWKGVSDVIGALVGDADSMDLTAYQSFVGDAKIGGAADLDGDLASIHALLEEGRYGNQLICSHYLSTNPLSSEVTPLPIAFTVMGQRFIVDSYVFSNVVYDRIVHDGQKVLRAMPSPLDAMFVLGANQALPLLQSELETYPYAGSLMAMRYLVDQYDDTFWTKNVYNLWLSAIRSLDALPEGEGLPTSMKTDAWAKKALNSQLASWAELRHDTLLYAKQSYTGGISCEYPDGYVEPYPALYAHLGAAAKRIDAVVGGLGDLDAGTKSMLTAWLDAWTTVMPALEGMATAELAETPFTAEQEAMFKSWIKTPDEGVCGGPSFTGWYPKLFFNEMNAEEADPTIADVHTNPNEDGPLAPARVLHVGTGESHLMVFTRNTCEGSRAYVGPVTSYYEVTVEGLDRMTDSEWATQLQKGAPPRPEWTGEFVVKP